MYRVKHPKHYRKQFDGSNNLFKECWANFLHSSPNVEDDSEVIDYLDAVASELVNDEESEFYLYG